MNSLKKYSTKLNGVFSIRTITSVYKYIANTTIVKINICDIRACHIKDCMDSAYVIVETGKDKGQKRQASADTKARIKSMFNLMLGYAFKQEYITKNFAKEVQVSMVFI